MPCYLFLLLLLIYCCSSCHYDGSRGWNNAHNAAGEYINVGVFPTFYDMLYFILKENEPISRSVNVELHHIFNGVNLVVGSLAKNRVDSWGQLFEFLLFCFGPFCPLYCLHILLFMFSVSFSLHLEWNLGCPC